MIRLLIVEDQPEVLKGLLMRLSAEADLSIVGKASDCEAALSLACSTRPDVVLIDADMPRLDGLGIASSLHLSCPAIPILILSLHNDMFMRQRIKESGAVGLVAKSLPADHLIYSIRQIGSSSSAG